MHYYGLEYVRKILFQCLIFYVKVWFIALFIIIIYALFIVGYLEMLENDEFITLIFFM